MPKSKIEDVRNIVRAYLPLPRDLQNIIFCYYACIGNLIPYISTLLFPKKKPGYTYEIYDNHHIFDLTFYNDRPSEMYLYIHNIRLDKILVEEVNQPWEILANNYNCGPKHFLTYNRHIDGAAYAEIQNKLENIVQRCLVRLLKA